MSRSDRAFPGNPLWLARVDDPARPFAGPVSFGPVATDLHAHPAPPADGRVLVFASARRATTPPAHPPGSTTAVLHRAMGLLRIRDGTSFSRAG
ncbi:MAG TPA: hypothetical protein VH092_25520 [Urbifossiella sp.]|nr:hypothetical protein [Urbifossiella sp.]